MTWSSRKLEVLTTMMKAEAARWKSIIEINKIAVVG